MNESFIESSSEVISETVSEASASFDSDAVLASETASSSSDVPVASDLTDASEVSTDTVSSGDVTSPAAVQVTNVPDYSEQLSVMQEQITTLTEDVVILNDLILTGNALLTLIAGLVLFFWCHARIRNAVRSFTGRWHND